MERLMGVSLALLLVVGCAGPGELDSTSEPLAACGSNVWNVKVGAIRWDAWYGAPTYTPAGFWQRVTWALSPRKYWNRLPFFADTRSGVLKPIDGSHPSSMGEEIRSAYNAGIDYWAFLDYPTSWSAVRRPLRVSGRMLTRLSLRS